MAIAKDYEAPGQYRMTQETASTADLPGLAVRLQPCELSIELCAKESDPLAGRISSLWHRVNPPRGMTVRLTSTSDQLRIIRLTVESDSAGWSSSWPRWMLAVRRAPELLGGSAVDAQDALSEDQTVLTLLVLPGETRTAVLDFPLSLDGATYPGTYQFEVVATDAETSGSCALAGLVELRHPASRLLDLLPALYRQPPTGPDGAVPPAHETPFFERYMRGFQDSVDPLQQALEAVPELFGAYSAPSDFLPWLATWVALALDENWPEMRRRRLIAEAVELYRWRGTQRGLSRYLEIFAGARPEINDQPFKGMRLGPDAILGRNTVLGDVPDHSFVVTLAVPDPSAINEQSVRDIIEAEKPAHAAYSLRIVSR